MDVIHAKLMTANYRMPARALPEKPRLDGLLRDMGEWLGEAMEREGFSDNDWICVRSVNSRVRIALAANDEDIAAKWAMSIAASIRMAVESGSSNVLRYRSRSHALRDLVERVLERDFSRSWAWRQLGFTRSYRENSDAKGLLVEALQSEPALMVRMLVHFASKGSLPVLFGKLPLQEWESLAAAAWKTAGGLTLPKRTGDPVINDEVKRRADLILRKSVIVRALRQLQANLPDELRWLISIFGVLEYDPSAVRRAVSHESRNVSLVAAVAQQIGEQIQRSPATSLLEQSPEPRRSAKQDFFYDEALTTYESRFGGLLLILQLCCQLDIFTRLVEAFRKRTLHWALQQVALRLVPANEDDPSVLAFSGCLPNDVSPSREEPLPNDLEEEELARCITVLTDELEHRLVELKLKGDRLLHFLCHRWCRVEADPGWIQIHFSLSDVSTDIRRAALDLDPGFIPALGVTVVFHYE
jgi:hypothetical protein